MWWTVAGQIAYTSWEARRAATTVDLRNGDSEPGDWRGRIGGDAGIADAPRWRWNLKLHIQRLGGVERYSIPAV